MKWLIYKKYQWLTLQSFLRKDVDNGKRTDEDAKIIKTNVVNRLTGIGYSSEQIKKLTVCVSQTPSITDAAAAVGLGISYNTDDYANLYMSFAQLSGDDEIKRWVNHWGLPVFSPEIMPVENTVTSNPQMIFISNKKQAEKNAYAKINKWLLYKGKIKKILVFHELEKELSQFPTAQILQNLESPAATAALGYTDAVNYVLTDSCYVIFTEKLKLMVELVETAVDLLISIEQTIEVSRANRVNDSNQEFAILLRTLYYKILDMDDAPENQELAAGIDQVAADLEMKNTILEFFNDFFLIFSRRRKLVLDFEKLTTKRSDQEYFVFGYQSEDLWAEMWGRIIEDFTQFPAQRRFIKCQSETCGKYFRVGRSGAKFCSAPPGTSYSCLKSQYALNSKK